ncbi:MAG: sensor histidine kinase [Phototrophicaceae bacterium]|jgi:two-component system sensor histidine kinase DegS
MTDMFFDNPTEELVHRLNVEMTSISNRMREIGGQIDSYELIVRREEQRNTDVVVALRTMYDNFDTMPREDIRNQYDEAIEANKKLFSMRSQLDMLKSTRNELDSIYDMLGEVLEKIEGGIEMGSGRKQTKVDASPQPGSMNIIRIVQAQEDERRRLANQMHDGPAQSLTNFVLQAEICQRLFDRNPESTREELASLKESAQLTFQRVRDFIADLRPMMLDDLGLIPTVNRYIEGFAKKSEIKITFDPSGGQASRRLKGHQEVILFRAVQSLLGQARDFADATEITVRLDIEQVRAIAVVIDNGRGFNVESAFAGDHAEGTRAQGIQTIRETFELINGKVTVTSDEQKGGSEVRIEMEVSDR